MIFTRDDLVVRVGGERLEETIPIAAVDAVGVGFEETLHLEAQGQTFEKAHPASSITWR